MAPHTRVVVRGRADAPANPRKIEVPQGSPREQPEVRGARPRSVARDQFRHATMKAFGIGAKPVEPVEVPEEHSVGTVGIVGPEGATGPVGPSDPGLAPPKKTKAELAKMVADAKAKKQAAKKADAKAAKGASTKPPAKPKK